MIRFGHYSDRTFLDVLAAPAVRNAFMVVLYACFEKCQEPDSLIVRYLRPHFFVITRHEAIGENRKFVGWHGVSELEWCVGAGWKIDARRSGQLDIIGRAISQ